ncbi:MAG: AIR synthase family protein [Nitrososphaerota archaeon]|nr:AIR synthase family protein [Nitrososphaerota archaeon]
MKRLQLGKLPIDILRRTMLTGIGAHSDLVVEGPKPGLDFATVRLDGGFLLVSADPITGATEDIGRYAIHVSANDVATSGTRPMFAETVVLLAEGSSVEDAAGIGKQMHETAASLRMAIVGGHTEVTPGLKKTIVVVTAFGYAKKYVSSSGAKAGDTMMMTKFAGLEGTSEIATERADLLRGVPQAALRRAGSLISQVSVVEEAVAAFATGSIHAMHDCTEGGVLGAAYEMSLASGLGFVLRRELVPVLPETAKICEALSIDPLKLIGSGALLLAVRKGEEIRVEKALGGMCRVTRIGNFAEGARLVVGRGGSKLVMTDAPQDELWRVFRRPPLRG